MAKKQTEATEMTTPETTALTTAPESDIMALSNGGDLKQIIEENFGGSALTLGDLDKIKIPSAGNIHWSIPSVIEGEDDTTKELQGVIIAWADKKSWWAQAYGDSGGGTQPDCKSNDMVHGLGNPTSHFNEKEQALMDAGKIGMPVKSAGGYLCATCPHNQFGSAEKGSGKACQDKRFIVFLMKDSIIPVLIRVPATSIMPLKQYFKRLAGAKRSYLSVLTGLSLTKIKGTQEYSQIVPKALRMLSDAEVAQVRDLRVPFQSALDAADSVDQGFTDKNVAGESLSDMPGMSDADLSAMTGQPVTDADGSAQKPF
jgi:hypothetical protein